MEPVIAYNILHSLELLTNAVDVLRTKCVTGITANVETCRKHLEASIPLPRHSRPRSLAMELAAMRLLSSLLTSTSTRLSRVVYTVPSGP